MTSLTGTPAGSVAPGYEDVRDAFTEVLASQQAGTGASFAAVVDGRLAVDLWGGAANPAGMPWQEDTLCVLFSGTKGIVATALMVLVDRGRLRLTDRVVDHWPAFAAAGKTDITVTQLGAHAAGLPYIDQPIDLGDLTNPLRLEELLAAQAPVLPVGPPCYHALTWGWLCDGLIRHVCGRSAAELAHETLAEPLGLDLRIGLLGEEAAAGRLARLQPAAGFTRTAPAIPDPDPRLRQVYTDAWTSANDDAWLATPVPASNGVATARAMATLYGAVVIGNVVGLHTLEEATETASQGDDELTGRPLRFGATGYELWGTPSRLGPAADAFGHTGAGGSTHGGWPRLRTGYSFVTSELQREDIDDRALRLLERLHAAAVRA